MKRGLLAVGVFFVAGALNAWDAQEQDRESEMKKRSFQKISALVSCLSSDMKEYIPELRQLAKQCCSVAELNRENSAVTWAILEGLSENKEEKKTYFGNGTNTESCRDLFLMQQLSLSFGVFCIFSSKSEFDLDFNTVDLLFIDSIGTYAHLTYELEEFSSRVSKYIAIHNTSEPCAYSDSFSYRGDRSEYPAYVNKEKKGTWLAVWDFVTRHPEWRIAARFFNARGFTVLERIEE